MIRMVNIDGSEIEISEEVRVDLKDKKKTIVKVATFVNSQTKNGLKFELKESFNKYETWQEKKSTNLES